MWKIICITVIFILFGAAPITALEGFAEISPAGYEIVDGVSGITMKVTVDGFLIGKAEVTQREYESVMQDNPSYHKGPDLPVESVTWWDAIRYCNIRSAQESLEPCYDLSTGSCEIENSGYRLPTDAEWSLADSTAAGQADKKPNELANLGSTNTKSVEARRQELKEHGTLPAGSFPPNAFGIHDMPGNVWEWCTDYADPADYSAYPPDNPRGPSWGTERIIRGGSFASMTNSWSRGYRSSMKPDYRSRFTGFRICRSTGKIYKEADSANWFEPYNRAPDTVKNDRGTLSNLLLDSGGNSIGTLSAWQKKREEIRKTWTGLLGTMPVTVPPPDAAEIEVFNEEGYTGKLMYLQVEPDIREKIFVMIPDRPIRTPTPVVITPYYDVDTPAGKNMGGRSFRPPGVRSFAYLAVRQGYIAVAVRWFGESYGEQYGEAVANLVLRHPGLTGLGKWVWDAHRVVDYIYTMPEADRENIGIIGHSLGGKMSLYAAAFDERITAVVSSELGIGLSFSNYDDFWYFGDFIRDLDPKHDHHELLALIAPRPFLLIGGDEYDKDESWHYINAARDVYTLYDKQQNIGYFNHHTGHSPTPEAVYLSMEWLKHFLNQRP